MSQACNSIAYSKFSRRDNTYESIQAICSCRQPFDYLLWLEECTNRHTD